MFETLSEKLQRVFKNLRGEGRLTEQHIEEALKEIRMALLEADVNFKVVKQFTEAVKSKAIGEEVLQSLSPGQQVVKIVRDELIEIGCKDPAKPPHRESSRSGWKGVAIGQFWSPLTCTGLQRANS